MIAFVLTITYGCNDDGLNPDANSFKASAFIEVINTNGKPVTDASVSTIQNKNGALIVHEYGMTDKRGVIALRKIDMYPSTYVSVSKEGYFTGSRRFYPTAGKSHLIRIMLLDEAYVGFINAQNGGSLNVENKVRLAFPPNAIAAENGQPYSGDVELFVQPISADDKDLSQKMPGNLVGINTSGKQGSLGSFGMVAVTLRSPSGERLQVMSGFAVEMRLKVPPSNMNTAPYTIPMWYFDDSEGYWKEEGSATLVDGEYVAQLTHFTFWNCDDYFDKVKWGATFVYDNGAPAAQVQVCITIESLGVQACDYTDENGFICGAVAANEPLLVQVKSWCNEVTYSQEYGPYSDSTILGTITIPASNGTYSTVHGVALKCNGDPVTDGYVNMNIEGYNSFALVDAATGAFSLTVLDCDQADIRVIAYDAVGIKESHPVIFGYAPDVNAGSITACEQIQELIKLSATGLPDDYYFLFPSAYKSEFGPTIIVSQDSLHLRFFYARIDADSAGTFVPSESDLSFKLQNGTAAWSDSLTITIGYYGEPDDYISGTFTGTLHTGDVNNPGPDYPMDGVFNVLRKY